MGSTDSHWLMPPRFREVQRLRANPMSWVGIVAVTLGGGAFVFASTRGPFPLITGAAAALLMVGVGLLLLFGELRTEVRDDALYVRFVPLTRQHRFPWSEIRSAVARRYQPIREYGGWGVRWGPSGKAYNVHGNRGLQLELAGGARLLIGSQRVDELAMAVENARSADAR